MSIDKIVELFQTRGQSQYGGEAVSQLEHALQCAYLAEQEQAPRSLVVAALLHDIGHLLHDLPVDAPDCGQDDHHQNSGGHFLQAWFAPEVSEPIRLHVDAKRYLCATEPDYRQQLSRPSIVSLNLQGGPMSADEIRQFENNPHHVAAIRLRVWDDRAKVPQLPTPDLEHYGELLRQEVLPGSMESKA